MIHIDLGFDITYHITDSSMTDGTSSNVEQNETEYRRELLKFFKLEQYNDTIISMRTDRLFFELKHHDQFKELFEIILQHPMVALLSQNSEINSACLVLLLSYDYFYIFFNCLKDYKQNNSISLGNFSLIKDELLKE